MRTHLGHSKGVAVLGVEHHGLDLAHASMQEWFN